MDSLIYQDNTHKDIWLKLILSIPLALILVPALYSLARNNTETAIEMFGVVVFILSSKHVVEIVRIKRMNVTITPDNPKLFLENLDKALNEWQQRHGRGAQ